MVLFNNSAYGNVLRDQQTEFGGRLIGSELHNPDFQQLAASFGVAFQRRLVTQMYFPGEWLNAHDRLIHSIADPAARTRLVCREVPTAEAEGDWLAFTHTPVVRGRHATPPLP